jgi:ribA/ribD-fused uncharacterized protein
MTSAPQNQQTTAAPPAFAELSEPVEAAPQISDGTYTHHDASWRASADPVSYVFFYGHSPQNPLAAFSQWYAGGPFTDGVNTYPTAEHYMMYSKAVLFGDDKVAAKILAPRNAHPGSAKKLGRLVKGFDQFFWDEKADDIVRRGDYLKFRGELWPLLDGTGDKMIVEAASNDAIWGIGIGADLAMTVREHWGMNRYVGPPLNKARARARGGTDSRLGLALVAVREQIRAERVADAVAEGQTEGQTHNA